MDAAVKSYLKGGEFLTMETKSEDVFIPENWNEEQLMIAQTCGDFLEQKVLPVIDRIDAQEEGLMASLIEQAGELGLLSISLPEEYGGFGKDFLTSMLISEKTGSAGSFSVGMMAHKGIGTLPILYYGNADQKQKYIPKLATGEWKGAYCLTEPGAGSDANSGKTKAKLSADGKYYSITGQKMWITNAGFADVFTVFAKIDDDANLSGFIIEKSFEGISLNPEEHKMGIKGSSTRQVFFNDCKVPVGNLLSERGSGFKIAVNILNLGRIKLGGMALGAAKAVITQAVRYANGREQFNQPISNYGAIRYKLAQQAICTYATESAIYRASRNIEDAAQSFTGAGMDEAKAKLKGVELFAIEAAMIKVHASETLDYVADEGVQIFGGMGYSADAPMDRAYRDSRINRIFEGTNEINRILIVDMMLKRSAKGELDFIASAQKVANDLTTPDLTGAETRANCVAGLKQAALLVAGAAIQKFGTGLGREQEVLMYISDMVIEVYVSESLLLRVQKLGGQRGESNVKDQTDMMQVYINDAADRIFKAGKEAVNAFAEGSERDSLLERLKRFTATAPLNTTAARRRIAAKLITENKYCF